MDTHAQDFVVNNEVHSHCELSHKKLLEMLGVLGLCEMVEQPVAPTSKSSSSTYSQQTPYLPRHTHPTTGSYHALWSVHFH